MNKVEFLLINQLLLRKQETVSHIQDIQENSWNEKQIFCESKATFKQSIKLEKLLLSYYHFEY